jgi:hypothetical protein
MLRRVAGEHMREAIFVQPDWLRSVPTDKRLPEGRVLYTGCGTSFHAAQTRWGLQCRRWSWCWRPSRRRRARRGQPRGRHPADARGGAGVRRLGLAGDRETGEPAGELADEVIVATPEVERKLVPHGELHLRGGDARRTARRGREWLPEAVEKELRNYEPVSAHERFVIAAPGATGRPRRRRR